MRLDRFAAADREAFNVSLALGVRAKHASTSARAVYGVLWRAPGSRLGSYSRSSNFSTHLFTKRTAGSKIRMLVNVVLAPPARGQAARPGLCCRAAPVR